MYFFLLVLLSALGCCEPFGRTLRPHDHHHRLHAVDGTGSAGDTKRLKVLCLHGYLSNARMFQAQLQKLVNEASYTSDFVFIDAPHRLGLQKREATLQKKVVSVESSLEGGEEARLEAGDEESSRPRRGASGKFRWWYAGTVGTGDEEELVQYMGLRESLLAIAEADRQYGPFDVVLGHSQGACLAVTIDALSSRPEFLHALLKTNELEESKDTSSTSSASSSFDEEQVVAAIEEGDDDEGRDNVDTGAKRLLPSCSLSVIVSGFQPRDYLFDKLFSDVASDVTMRGLPQRSLHVFSHEDDIVPAAASIQAMALYDFPRMKVRNGDHDPPRDDDTVEYITMTLQALWKSKFSPPLKLED